MKGYFNMKKFVIGFALGGGIGGVVGWLLTRDKYRRLADEEIESVVNKFRDKPQKKKPPTYETSTDEDLEQIGGVTKAKPGIMDFYTQSENKQQTDYTSFHKQESEDVPAEETDINPPEDIEPLYGDPDPILVYEISYDQYATKEDYSVIGISRTDDGIFLDENDVLIPEPHIILGPDYEDILDTDATIVYIRNDERAVDIEVILSSNINTAP